MEITSMSFSDIHFTGEHEDYENLVNAQIRFRGEPWGIETKLLGASSHIWSPLHMMIGLLHGTHNWGFGVVGRDDMARKFLNIRKAYEKFGYKTAEWLPYFKYEGKTYTVGNDKVKVSMYLHKGKDALLIAGNLNKEAVDANILLHPDSLGMESKKLSARNALTGQPLAVDAKGNLQVKIKAKSFVLIKLEAR